MLERTAFVVERPVTGGAVHGVNLHAVNQIVVGGGQRIGYTWGMTVHGSVESVHGNAHLDVGRRRVGVGGHIAEQGESQSAEHKNKNRNHNSKNEVTHEPSARDPNSLRCILSLAGSVKPAYGMFGA